VKPLNNHRVANLPIDSLLSNQEITYNLAQYVIRPAFVSVQLRLQFLIGNICGQVRVGLSFGAKVKIIGFKKVHFINTLRTASGAALNTIRRRDKISVI